jgi:hypothetical protein
MKRDLLNMLLDHADLSVLVDRRINITRRVQGEGFPAVILSGVSAEKTQLQKCTSEVKGESVQLDIYGESYAEVFAVAEVIDALLDSFRGQFGDTFFCGVFFEARRDGYDDGAADELHRISIDYRVTYKEQAQ